MISSDVTSLAQELEDIPHSNCFAMLDELRLGPFCYEKTTFWRTRSYSVITSCTTCSSGIPDNATYQIEMLKLF